MHLEAWGAIWKKRCKLLVWPGRVVLTAVWMMPKTLPVYLPYSCAEVSSFRSQMHSCIRPPMNLLHGSRPSITNRSPHTNLLKLENFTFQQLRLTLIVTVGQRAANACFRSRDQSKEASSLAAGIGLLQGALTAISLNGILLNPTEKGKATR